MKKLSGNKDVSVKAVKQKLELSAAKVTEQQKDIPVSADQGVDGKNTTQKAAMIDGRKINLSEFVKNVDGKVTVTLKLSDKSAIDQLKLTADKVQLIQDGNKLKISGDSADVREVLESVLFEPNSQQKGFSITIEVSSDGRSEKVTLFMDFNNSTNDFTLRQHTDFTNSLYPLDSATDSFDLYMNGFADILMQAPKGIGTTDFNTSAKPEADAFTLSSPTTLSSRMIDNLDVRLVDVSPPPPPSPPPVVTAPEPTPPPVIPTPPVSNGGGGGGSPTPAAPVNTLPATYTTNEDTNLVLSGISVADSDTPTPASVTISTTNGILNILDNVAGGITAGMIAGNGTAAITITGVTLSQINTTLVNANGITFIPTSGYLGTATVTVTTNDGALTDVDTSTITVNAIPVISTLSGSSSYTENAGGSALDTSITLADADNTNLAVATISISANFVTGDRLNFTDQNGITGSYNPSTGVLTLTGAATLADYETALESITFDSTSENPTSATRTITYTVTDGITTSNAPTYTVNVTAVNDAPVNSIPGAVTMINGDTLQLLGMSVADDNTSLTSYTLSVGSGTLNLNTGVASGITAGQVAGNGTSTITITGATIAQINNTLNDSAGLNFTPVGVGVVTLTVTANDSALTDVDTRTITVNAAPSSGVNLSTLNGTNGFTLINDVSGYGFTSVSNIGDINGDGFEDVIAGIGQSTYGPNYSGQSFVIFGKSGGFTSSISIASLDGTDGFRLDGHQYNARSGTSVANAGDVNGDGFDDFIIGAFQGQQPVPYNYTGVSYVVFGKASGYTSKMDLSALNGTDGFRLDGVASQDRAGRSVSSAGDVNGDGFDDLIIGSYGADPNGNYSGSSYVVFGKASGFTSNINLSTLNGTNGFRLDGVAVGDRSGFSASNAGDVNGDGFDDLIVGARGAAPNGSSSGSNYVVFGAASGFTSSINLSTLNGTNGFKLDGEAASDYSGYSVSNAGDINGDGFDDLIVGALGTDPSGLSSGSSYVVFGKASGFTSAINLSTLNGTTGFRLDGVAVGDLSGRSVSSAGDVNGDGFDDLIVGAFGADPNGGTSGSSYVVFGKASGWSSSINLSTLNGTNGYRLDGVAMNDQSGRSVSSAGDVDGDGFDDIIIASYARSDVVFGSNNSFTAGTGGGDTLVGTLGADKFDGRAGNDSISGGLGADTLIGGLGNDTIDGGAGSDVMKGGAGNDVFIYSAGDSIDGGRGTDTLQITGNLNITSLAHNQVTSVEVLNALSDAGANAITLSVADAIALSKDSNRLTIDGSSNDSIALNLENRLFTQGTSGGYTTYTFSAGGFQIWVDSDITQTFTNTLNLADVGGAKFYQQNGAATLLDNSVTVTDLFAGTLSSATISVGNFFAGDTLNFTNQNGITGSYNAGTGVLTLSGTSSRANYETALESITFQSTSGTEIDRVIGFSVSDGVATSNTEYVNINYGIIGVIKLAQLDGTNGFRLDGVTAGDQSGTSVSNAGDINGDGFEDIIVGAPAADPNGNISSGSSYVVFGKASGFTSAINLSTLNGTTGFRLDGLAAGDQSGFSVSNAGDVNGDGFDDLIVGARFADPNGYNSGSSYVVFGAASGFTSSINLSDLDGTTGFRLDGVAVQDSSGFSVSNAGDMNGDGFDDLIVGAYRADPNGNYSGSSYVVFGKASGFSSNINLSSLNGSTGFRLDGVTTSDNSGRSVSSAGDVNGDGFDDLILGAFRADPNGNASGSSYVVFGKASGFTSSINLSSLNGTTGFRLDGSAAGDYSGASVSNIGDVNGDGFDDLSVGATGADTNGNQSGSSYVVFGKASGFTSSIHLSTLDGTTGFRLDGVAASDYSGYSVSSAGDVNGDGFDDLIVGAQNAAGATGRSYVIFGKASGFTSSVNLSTLNGVNGYRLDGVLSVDQSGRSVSSAGDVDGDGFDDLIVGASSADPNGNNDAGSSYVIFGNNNSGAVTHLGTSGNNALTGTASVDVVVGGLGDDTIDGLAGADVMKGGAGNDVFIYGAGDKVDGGRGTDTLRINSNLNITSLANNQITGVEVIDALTDSAANTVTLTVADALGLAKDANRLTIDGNASDTIVLNMEGKFFSQTTSGGYDVYTFFDAGGFQIFVDSDINKTLTNTASLLDVGGTVAYMQKQPAAVIDSAVTIRSLSANIVSATVSIGNFQSTDTLNFTDQNGITGSYNSGTGVLTLTGTATKANYELALESITFRSDSGTQADRTVNFVINDGVENSNTGIATISYTKIPAVINLSSLNGTNGFRLNGVAANDSSGDSVSNAGDVNGDGFDDLIVGARAADPNGSMSGSSYVIFGSGSGFGSSINLSALNGTNGFRLDGVAASNESGRPVSNAGDINGDGFDDLIVGAISASPNGISSGSSYVVFGKASGFTSSINLSTLNGTTGFRLDGVAANDFSANSISSAGDVNGDGFDDLIIGAVGADPNGINNSGSSYVIFGASSGFASSINLSTLNGTNGFRLNGFAAFDNSGNSVSSAGDVNGDGFDDLIIAAYQANTNGVYSGASYVVFGSGSGFSSSINLSTLNGTTGFRLDGIVANDRTGRSVSSAGDINGDGYDDVIVGSRDATPNGAASGASYVVFGKASGFTSNINLSTLNGSNGFRLDGVAANDFSGWPVSSAGDVNGDGFDDLIVGARDADPNGNNSGSSYIVFGKASGFTSGINLSTLDGTNGYRLDGATAFIRSSNSVSSAGDVDGDGFDDLIVGAYGASPNGISNSGSSYVIFGSNSTGAVTHLGTSGNDSLTGTSGADTMIGGRGNDTINGGANADFIKGAFGNDVITGGAGADRIWGGAGNDVFIYTANSDSGIGTGNRDIIYDFESTIDDIDLSAFAGTFTFRGTSAFTGTANEVRFTLTGSNTLIQVDSNANGITDFEIHLLGAHSIVGADFVL